MTRRAAGQGPSSRSRALLRVADSLHSAAIRLLRRLRVEDAKSGVSAARMSALSVLVFRGPSTLADLARAEQVKPPTMSKLIDRLQREGFVTRTPDPSDARSVRLRPTAKGRRLLEAGRRRRVERLALDLASLTPAETRAIRAAAGLIERVARAGSEAR